MAYKAVVFDLDGTLVHTTPEYRYLIVGQTLKDLGAISSNHHIDRFWFEARRDEIIIKDFKLEPELFWQTFRKNDAPELRKQFTKPYNDIDFLDELRQKDYKTGIVTGAPINIASLEIEMLDKNNFDAIIIAHTSNGFKPKPHKHGLEECLNLLKINKDEAIYVGNSNEDVETARNAQVFDVFLERGEYKFLDINPSLRIYSLYDLRQLLGITGNSNS